MMHAGDIELVLANHFGYRHNLIVPNVSWGIFHHQEVDVLILRPSGYAVEIEIKVSVSDVKRDLDKHHAHNSRLVRQTWFAMPDTIANKATPMIPDRFGVLAVYQDGRVRTLRVAKVNKDACKWTTERIAKLHELAAMRIWTLKEALYSAKRTNPKKGTTHEQDHS